MQRRTVALHSAAAAAALALPIRGRSQALEKPRTTIAVGGKSLLQGRASQIVLGVNPKTMAGIRVLTGFALLLDALVGRIERRLMKWQPRAGETEKR